MLSLLSSVSIKFCNPHTGAMTHTRWHPMTHRRPRQEIACSQSTQTKDAYICCSWSFLFRRGHWHYGEIAEACSRFGAEIVLEQKFWSIVTWRSQWDASPNESLLSCDIAKAQEISISTHRWWVVRLINSNLWFSNL